MTVDEVARSLGIGRQGVRKAIARGTLPARLGVGKYGPEYDVSPVDVERYRARASRAWVGKARAHPRVSNRSASRSARWLDRQ